MRKLLIVAPIVAVLLLVAAGAGWYFLIRSNASPLTDPLPIPSSLLNTTPSSDDRGRHDRRDGNGLILKRAGVQNTL